MVGVRLKPHRIGGPNLSARLVKAQRRTDFPRLVAEPLLLVFNCLNVIRPRTRFARAEGDTLAQPQSRKSAQEGPMERS